MSWPPRSPDITSCYFVLWEFVKEEDKVKAPITEAVAAIDNIMPKRVRPDLGFRLDECRVTIGANIEHSIKN